MSMKEWFSGETLETKKFCMHESSLHAKFQISRSKTWPLRTGEWIEIDENWQKRSPRKKTPPVEIWFLPEFEVFLVAALPVQDFQKVVIKKKKKDLSPSHPKWLWFFSKFDLFFRQRVATLWQLSIGSFTGSGNAPQEAEISHLPVMVREAFSKLCNWWAGQDGVSL